MSEQPLDRSQDAIDEAKEAAEKVPLAQFSDEDAPEEPQEAPDSD